MEYAQLFAHCNGFYAMDGVFCPRECYIARIAPPFRGRGVVVKMNDLNFSMKDIRSNIFVMQNISGLKFPTLKGTEDQREIDGKELSLKLQCLISSIMRRSPEEVNFLTISVKGFSQLKFFLKILPNFHIVDLGDQLPKYKDLFLPHENVGVTHHGYHSESLHFQCSKYIAEAFSKYIWASRDSQIKLTGDVNDEADWPLDEIVI